MRKIIYYLSEVLFRFRPPIGASRIKMYCVEIVISDALIRTVNLEMELFFYKLQTRLCFKMRADVCLTTDHEKVLKSTAIWIVGTHIFHCISNVSKMFHSVSSQFQETVWKWYAFMGFSNCKNIFFSIFGFGKCQFSYIRSFERQRNVSKASTA